MIFLQGAARKNSPAGVCLNLAEARFIDLFVSPAIFAEIRDVLERPKVRRKFPVLTNNLTEHFLNTLSSFTILIHDVPNVYSFARDPKDEPYINLALAARADYLVTWDSDLLDLAKETSAEEQLLRDPLPTLKIVDPVTFLKELL